MAKKKLTKEENTAEKKRKQAREYYHSVVKVDPERLAKKLAKAREWKALHPGYNGAYYREKKKRMESLVKLAERLTRHLDRKRHR